MDWLKETKAIIDRMQATLDKYSEMRDVVPLDVQRERMAAAADDTSWWLTLLLQMYGRGLEESTGYDVYCAQDAPAFAAWERVAASVKDVNFVSELLNGAEDWASDIRWDNDEYTEARLVSNQYPRIHRHEVLRRYRILPAGSPPPGNEVSE